MKKVLGALALTVAFVLGAVGCSGWNNERGLGDAPVMEKNGNDDPAVVINFPDTFANVAIKCFNGTAIISHTREAQPLVIADSTFCDGDKVVKVGDGPSFEQIDSSEGN